MNPEESTMLVYRKLHGYKYDIRARIVIRVNCPYNFAAEYYSVKDGYMYVEVGYAYDGPSGPAIDTPDFMLASLVHDVFYQAMREGLLPLAFRKIADKEMYRVCIGQGMWRIRANGAYHFVRLLSEHTAKPEKNPRGQIVRLAIKPMKGGGKS